MRIFPSKRYCNAFMNCRTNTDSLSAFMYWMDIRIGKSVNFWAPQQEHQNQTLLGQGVY